MSFKKCFKCRAHLKGKGTPKASNGENTSQGQRSAGLMLQLPMAVPSPVRGWWGSGLRFNARVGTGDMAWGLCRWEAGKGTLAES